MRQKNELKSRSLHRWGVQARADPGAAAASGDLNKLVIGDKRGLTEPSAPVLIGVVHGGGSEVRAPV